MDKNISVGDVWNARMDSLPEQYFVFQIVASDTKPNQSRFYLGAKHDPDGGYSVMRGQTAWFDERGIEVDPLGDSGFCLYAKSKRKPV